MDLYEEFLTALEAAKEQAGNLHQLSKACGIGYSTLYRWRKRDQVPSLETLKKLLPLLTSFAPHVPVIQRMGDNAPQEECAGMELQSVPVVLQVGAGNPVDDLWQEPVERTIPVLPQYYRADLRAFEVVGDSMEPTIRRGAIVGVVPYDGILQEGGVYLCRVPAFGLVVKRVQPNGTHGVNLISDNAAYEPCVIDAAEYDHIIVGKVLWCWQTL